MRRWNVEQLLETRPVRRGQILLTVADVNGRWVLELQVPDERVRFVVEAREKVQASLPVEYVLASEPETVYRGTLDRLAESTTAGVDDRPVAIGRVVLDDGDLPLLRPGTEIVAKIRCGRRCLAYVWFHDLWYFLHAKLLF